MIYIPEVRGPRVGSEVDRVSSGTRAHAYGIGAHHIHDTDFDLRCALSACLTEPESDAARDESLSFRFGTLLHQGTTYGATCDDAWNDYVERAFGGGREP